MKYPTRRKKIYNPLEIYESRRVITIKNSGGDFPICGKSSPDHQEIISCTSGDHLPCIEIVFVNYWEHCAQITACGSSLKNEKEAAIGLW